MKRTAFFGVVLTVLALATTYLAAQQKTPAKTDGPTVAPLRAPTVTDSNAEERHDTVPPKRETSPAPTQAPTFGTTDDPFRGSISETTSVAPGIDTLQKRYLELCGKKARILKGDQLQSAIRDLEREVEGLNAAVRLDEAAKLLREISEKHPATPAAKTAAGALRVIEQRGEPTPNYPTPADGYRREGDAPTIKRGAVPFGPADLIEKNS